MNHLRYGISMLALGLALGGGGSALVRAPAIANAQAMGGMAMGGAASPGDAAMNAAMSRMSRAMGTAKLTGDQDRDFMVMMIPHHLAAVDMAKAELRYGKRAQVRALARDVVASQGKEIGAMRGWLARWYGAR